MWIDGSGATVLSLKVPFLHAQEEGTQASRFGAAFQTISLNELALLRSVH
jgi:hypothetical protein